MTQEELQTCRLFDITKKELEEGYGKEIFM